MKLLGKNRYRYSYIHKELKNKNFFRKDFDKTSIKYCKILFSKFIETSLRENKFYHCIFTKVLFKDCDFTNTSFKNNKFFDCKFINCTFKSVCFQKDLENKCLFTNCYFFNCTSFTGQQISKSFTIPDNICKTISELQKNQYIRKSQVLIYKGNFNIPVIVKLMDLYKNELQHNLESIIEIINTDFTTVSFLINYIEKVKFIG